MADLAGLHLAMIYRIFGAVVAIVILIASSGLSLLAVERGFGLAATLIVPTCCLGFWWSLTCRRPAQRIGWFAFSSVSVLLLPTGPWWQWIIELVLNRVQDAIRGPRPTLLYSAAEIVSILVLVLLPWMVACLMGFTAAKIATRLLHAVDEVDENQLAHFRFTLRGMFLSLMILAILTAWLSSALRHWSTHEEANRALFLERFTGSFTTGKMTLLAEPEIAEDYKTIRQLGISEYRVTAPIKTNGTERWAVWTYLCDERYPGTVSKFGYAEAATLSGLPPHPFPATEHLIEPTSTMLDGEPQLSTQAEVLSAPATAKPGDTITIVARTDRYLECYLVVRPFQAVTVPPPMLVAPETGLVRWDVKLNPAYSGSKLQYDFVARPNMLYRAKTVPGQIVLDSRRSDEQAGD